MEYTWLSIISIVLAGIAAGLVFNHLKASFKEAREASTYNKSLLRQLEYERKRCEIQIHNLREYTIFAYMNRKQLAKMFDAIHDLPEENDTIVGIKMNMSSNRSINQSAMRGLNDTFREYFKMSIEEYQNLNQRRVKSSIDTISIGFSLQ